eukprot:CAMPEP_0170637820 /NCGR_PEP_ID=MMETSP0224-20130122/38647_1 /TAXON_ID=285029 /ORGANISM="Togula jolla, Strain CCCM 725" /LENGTH=544 /DNA_ID=CAMNT_0010967789 /DNA_START=19 /DNA_END=1653 /DNA_ORIENTATION=-
MDEDVFGMSLLQVQVKVAPRPSAILSSAPPDEASYHEDLVGLLASVAGKLQVTSGVDLCFMGGCAFCALISVGIYINSQMGQSEDTSPRQRLESADDSQIGRSTFSIPERFLRRRFTHISGEQKYGKTKWTIDDSCQTMNAFQFVVNMFTDLCPPGFLPLAYGLKNTGFVPGFCLLCFFCMLCIYTMYAVAKSAQITREQDYAGMWTRAIGRESSWVPTLVVVCVCFGCTLSYLCYIADIFTGVMPSLGFEMSRSFCLWSFILFPTMPLCLLKNLSALSYTSTFALLAVLYTAGVMVLRCVDGTYGTKGLYTGDIAPYLAPEVPDDHMMNFGLPSLVLVNMLALGFLAHYNACKYTRELRNTSPTKVVQCTAVAMVITACVFTVTMLAGYKTFGANSDGVILKNYSREDPLVNVARIGMGLSIVASFPLMFTGLREAVIALLKYFFPETGMGFDAVWEQDLLSLILLLSIATAATLLTDAGIVAGLAGAICGSANIYLIPCTLYAACINTFLSDKNLGELIWLRCLFGLGIFLSIAGVVSSLVF